MPTSWQHTDGLLRRTVVLIVIGIAVVAAALTWPTGAPAEPTGKPVQPRSASEEYFLDLDGIDGDSTVIGHEGELSLLNWSWSVGNDGAARRAEFADLALSLSAGPASPSLLLACAEGRRLRTAVLTARKPGLDHRDDAYLRITLSDVVVTSYQSAAGGGLPVEQLSLGYHRIVLEVRRQNDDGTFGEWARSGWDRRTNRPI